MFKKRKVGALKKYSDYFFPLAMMGAISICSSFPNGPGIGKGITYFDKIGHFFVFGLLATAIYRIPAIKSKGFRGVITTIILVAIFSFVDEVHQSFVPNRSMDIFDFIADLLGAAVAIYAYQLIGFYRDCLEFKIP